MQLNILQVKSRQFYLICFVFALGRRPPGSLQAGFQASVYEYGALVERHRISQPDILPTYLLEYNSINACVS